MARSRAWSQTEDEFFLPWNLRYEPVVECMDLVRLLPCVLYHVNHRASPILTNNYLTHGHTAQFSFRLRTNKPVSEQLLKYRLTDTYTQSVR